MLFSESDVAGVWIVAYEGKEDSRGSFARTWCKEEFGRHGLASTLSQCSISRNLAKGTLRGMHYQAAPSEEDKVVSVMRGAIYDVALDLRPASPTFRKWFAIELTERNERMLYIPAGCAHGFQTLQDDTVVEYKISTPFVAELARGVRWDDSAFGIRWPLADRILSDRDRAFPDFVP